MYAAGRFNHLSQEMQYQDDVASMDLLDAASTDADMTLLHKASTDSDLLHAAAAYSDLA